MKYISLALLSMAFGLLSCKTPKATLTTTDDTGIEIIEERQLDTLFVSAPPIGDGEDEELAPEGYQLAAYNSSYTRVHDLLHTRLDLRFDWEKEQVLGRADLTLTPYFYPARTLTLDAKDFEIHRLSLAGKEQQLRFEYDGRQLIIDLGREYNKGETYELSIEYTATPSQTGGSDAITSDQGLFFINPRGEEKDKPQQIWTQGETEWNSRWFPTIDKPNERTTQEVTLTVADRFTTLSNGVLVSSTENEDGTRTDYWKMDQPHAPYLFMLAIGEYAVVRDTWEGIPVEYYVEPAYEEDARAIFSHTPEMLSFFSEKLGVPYPWPKYAQVVVRDYVSGAMENTTSVIFGEFIQKHRRELIEENNERIVAHEMFHHWFGDLVTCESWANLTMNEGFANYAEYLWFEHQYGRDEADFHLLGEWSGYLGAARSETHPLIHFGYDSKDGMFDAHSYNKGGAVLHMLRHYVGDEAFWAALRLYLEDHAYTSVEAHDLRLAFEAITGEDLNWFFNQWFFNPGHPVLDIQYSYDPDAGEVAVTVEQTQDAETNPPIFILPVAIDVYLTKGEEPVRQQVRMTERLQTFTFPVPSEPKLIQFDGDRMLLCEREDNKTEDQLVFQFFNGPRLQDRYESILMLRDSDHPERSRIVMAALEDPHWVIRAIGLESLDSEVEDGVLNKLQQMAGADPDARVRTITLDKLGELGDAGAADVARQAIEQDSSYGVIASALYLLRGIDPGQAITYAEKLMDEPSDQVLEVVEIVFEESNDPKYLPYFEKRLSEVDGFSAVSMIRSYQGLVLKADTDTRKAAMERLQLLALDQDQSPWRKLAATKAITDTRRELEQRLESTETESERNELQAEIDKLTEMLVEIKNQETDEELRSIYDQFD